MESLVLRAVLAECGILRGRTVAGITVFPGSPRWSVEFRPHGAIVIDLSGASPALYGTGLEAAPPVPGARPHDRPERTAKSRQGISGILDERLTGAKAVDFRTWGLNRLAMLSFEKRDRFGDPVATTLLVELFGSWGNLIVLDGPPETGRILDRLRPDRRRTAGRALDRGQPYAFPARIHVDLLLDGVEKLAARLAEPPVPDDPAGWARRFQDAAEGVSGATARRVVARAPRPLSPAGLTEAWASLVEVSSRGGPAALLDVPGRPPHVIVTVPGDEPGAGAPLLAHPSPSADGAPLRAFSTTSAAVLAALLEAPGPARTPDGSWLELSGWIAARREKAERLHARLTEELARRPDGAADRLRAETLLAAANQVERGAPSVVLASPHGGEPMEIPLDPLVGAAENASRYFREARKAELAREALPVRISRAAAEIAKLEEWSRRLAALGPGDEPGLASLRAEMEGRSGEGRSGGNRRGHDGAAGSPGGSPPGGSTPGAGHGRDRVPASLQPRRYELPGGWVALVGRSQAGNDYLTHRLAAPHDLWFHAHGASGSHVVLKAPDRRAEPDKSILLAAAALAALYSKARHASRVPVIYAEKRHVRKPRGSKPGLAAVTNEKSLMVKPAEPPSGEKRETS